MDDARIRPLSAADLNFNPARFPLERLVECAREHWGVDGDFTPLEGERDLNHRVTATDGRSYVLKVSAAGESEGAVDFQIAALRHLEHSARDLPVPRVIASKAGNDREWIVAVDGTRHLVRLLSWLPGLPVSRGEPLTIRTYRNVAAFQARLAHGLRGLFHPHARHFVAWDIQRALCWTRARRPGWRRMRRRFSPTSTLACGTRYCRACRHCEPRSCTATVTPTTCCARMAFIEPCGEAKRNERSEGHCRSPSPNPHRGGRNGCG